MSQYPEFLEIDGSIMEGGGQILRTSVSMSAILGIPVRVYNIRANRSKPGLAAQHLIGIKLVADMCGAKLWGDSIGSTEIRFTPGMRIKGGHYVADTRTAGSISLLMQIALPCALLADGVVTLDLQGGTNAEMAPQIDYMTEVFKNALKQFGATFDVVIHRRGYYPKGGGSVTVEIKPIEKFLAATITERGRITRIYGWSFVSGTLPLRLAKIMNEGFTDTISKVFTPVEVNVHKEDIKMAPHNCSGIIGIAETMSGCRVGADGLGKRGADPYEIGVSTGNALQRDLSTGACLDTHAQDQVIIYMALASGTSVIKVGELTLHTRTAIYIAELMAKTKFLITQEGPQNIIKCTGLGVVNRFHPNQIQSQMAGDAASSYRLS